MGDEGVVCDENKETEPASGKKSTNQLDYLQKVVLKSLCKHRSSCPFLEPVDPVKHNAPDYLEIIKTPMDLGTIRKKLSSYSYSCARECIDDINLVFSNCYVYNGEDNEVSKMGKEMEEFFNSKLTGMPAEEEEITPNANTKRKALDLPVGEIISGKRKISKSVHYLEISMDLESSKNKRKKPTVVSAVLDAVATPPPANGKNGRNGSNSGAAATHASPVLVPTLASKREPRSSNYYSRGGLSKITLAKTVDDDALIQSGLKNCLVLVKELLSKKYADFAWPFYQPVDPEKLNLLDYRDIIKHPRDLTGIKKKLESNGYAYAHECVSDLRLMLANCYRYNPPNSDVVALAKKVHEVMEFYIARLDGDVYTEFSVHRPVVFANSLSDTSRPLGGYAMNGTSYSEEAYMCEEDHRIATNVSRGSHHSSNSTVGSTRSGKNIRTAKTSSADYGNSNANATHKGQNYVGTAGLFVDNSAGTNDQSSGTQNTMLLMLEDRVKELYQELNKLRSEKDTGAAVDSATASNTESLPNGSERNDSSPVANGSKSGDGGKITESSVANGGDMGGDDYVPTSQSQMDDLSKSSEYAEPMYYDEMRQLTISMNQLPAEKILKILQIIQQREPELKKMQSDESEVEIDLEQLRPATLREIQRFVNSSLKRKRTAANQTSSNTSGGSTSSGTSKKRNNNAQSDIAQRREMIEKRLESVRHHFEIPTITPKNITNSVSNGEDLGLKNFSSVASSTGSAKSLAYSTLSEDSDSESEKVEPHSATISNESIESSSLLPNHSINKLNNATSGSEGSKYESEPVLLPPSASTVTSNYFMRDSHIPTSPEQSDLIKDENDCTDSNNNESIPDVTMATMSVPCDSAAIIERMKQEEERRRIAMVGRVDMNAQSDLLKNFEENHL